MAKRQKAEVVGVDPNGWMLTFSDLVTLLLTFFVMLLSMSSMDMDRLQKIFSIFTAGSGVLEMTDRAKIESVEDQLKELGRLTLDRLPSEEVLREVLLDTQDAFQTAVLGDLAKEIEVKRSERGIIMVFGARALFDLGQAVLKPEARQLLERVAEIAKQVDRPVSVEGHTDNTPLKPGGRFASNWDLSLARALAVRGFLVDQQGVDPRRIRVAALSDTKPVADNSTPEGRARNRRIEVVFDWLE